MIWVVEMFRELVVICGKIVIVFWLMLVLVVLICISLFGRSFKVILFLR